jgi:hypothetical protein
VCQHGTNNYHYWAIGVLCDGETSPWLCRSSTGEYRGRVDGARHRSFLNMRLMVYGATSKRRMRRAAPLRRQRRAGCRKILHPQTGFFFLLRPGNVKNTGELLNQDCFILKSLCREILHMEMVNLLSN